MDVKCAKCGEPWDHYGVHHGDMEADEAEKFLAGKGCPCCGFGTRCSACDGTGIEVPYPPSMCTCVECRDRRYIMAWSPNRSAPLAPYRGGEFYTGYTPGVRHVRDPGFEEPTVLGVRKFPERVDVVMTKDGPVESWWIECDRCRDNPQKNRAACSVCGGTGEMTSEPDVDLEAARTEIAASDEDPLEILCRRGLDDV